MERKDLESRQALVTEREKLTATFEHALPGLDAAIEKARKAAEKKRTEYMAAGHALDVALTARRSVVVTYDRERDGLNRELRASSSPVIDDFILELETRQHEVRHSSPEVHEVVDAPAGVRWFSRSPAITRTLDGITAARGAAEDLRLDAVENIDQAIADVCATRSRRWV